MLLLTVCLSESLLRLLLVIATTVRVLIVTATLLLLLLLCKVNRRWERHVHCNICICGLARVAYTASIQHLVVVVVTIVVVAIIGVHVVVTAQLWKVQLPVGIFGKREANQAGRHSWHHALPTQSCSYIRI